MWSICASIHTDSLAGLKQLNLSCAWYASDKIQNWESAWENKDDWDKDDWDKDDWWDKWGKAAPLGDSAWGAPTSSWAAQNKSAVGSECHSRVTLDCQLFGVAVLLLLLVAARKLNRFEREAFVSSFFLHSKVPHVTVCDEAFGSSFFLHSKAPAVTYITCVTCIMR